MLITFALGSKTGFMWITSHSLPSRTTTLSTFYEQTNFVFYSPIGRTQKVNGMAYILHIHLIAYREAILCKNLHTNHICTLPSVNRVWSNVLHHRSKTAKLPFVAETRTDSCLTTKVWGCLQWTITYLSHMFWSKNSFICSWVFVDRVRWSVGLGDRL